MNLPKRLIVPALATVVWVACVVALRPAEVTAEAQSPAQIEARLAACMSNPLAYFVAPIPRRSIEKLARGLSGDSFSLAGVQDYGSFSNYPANLMRGKIEDAVRYIHDAHEDFSMMQILVSIAGILMTLGFVVFGGAELGPKQSGRGVLLVLAGLLVPFLVSKSPSTLVMALPILVAGIVGLVLDARAASTNWDAPAPSPSRSLP